MCAAAKGLRALNFPCARRLVVCHVLVPGEIKVLPSDGREMAKRLVVDLNAMFPQGRNSAIQVNCIPQNDGSHDQG